MTTAKNEVFIGLKHENFYLVGKIHLGKHISTMQWTNFNN